MSATEEAENGRRHNVAVVGGGRGVGEMLTVGKSTGKGGASIDIITAMEAMGVGTEVTEEGEIDGDEKRWRGGGRGGAVGNGIHRAPDSGC